MVILCGVLPDSRARVLVYVEGDNDISCLQRFATMLRAVDDSVLDLASDPRIAFVPAGGSNLQHYVDRRYLATLDLPEWHRYDRDTDEPPRYQAAVDAVNARGDRDWAALTANREIENYLHPAAIAEALGVEVTFGDDDDVPLIVARAVHEADEDAPPWDDLPEDKIGKKCSNAKQRLSRAAAEKITPERLAERDPQNEVQGWFESLKALLT